MPGSSPNRPGTRRRGRRRDSRTQALDPEAIIKVAIRLADEEGLEAVSIRRIASALEGRPMDFYEHFESKYDLLWQMSDEVTGEALIAEPVHERWREAATAIARRTYVMLVGHPWVPTVSQINPRFGSNAEAAARQWAAAMSPLGLRSEEMWALVGTVNDYVLGHSYRAARVARPEDLDRSIAAPAIDASPELASLPDYLKSRDQVERFEAGLAIVLDGIAGRVGG